MRRHSVVFALVLTSTACASVDLEGLPFCSSIGELKPLPDAQSCADSELLEFQTRLSSIIEQQAGPLLVRVELDDSATPQSVCVDRDSATGNWVAKRAVADRVGDILSSSPGPGCTANKRIDLNRYQSKLAEIKRLERKCDQEVRTMVETNRHMNMDLRRRAHLEFSNCMESNADWIVLDPLGSNRVLIFAKPEVPDPPSVRAVETANRCSRAARNLDSQIACIQEDAWELLH